MSERDNFRAAADRVLDGNDVEQILSQCFFSDNERPLGVSAMRGQRPEHYKVICISLYKEDLTRLDEMVTLLKSRGLTKVSRSALIRFALSKVDLDEVPRGV